MQVADTLNLVHWIMTTTHLFDILGAKGTGVIRVIYPTVPTYICHRDFGKSHWFPSHVRITCQSCHMYHVQS
jgi:hypothetical protein